ncbi:hypothetical protein B0J11DRAFT_615662 [Dendryphion nanum]|uniref:Secreted protein n=1 Tax=Dendryphion nanum TaxID=256645 RepID=A0A9P9DSE2_9PLEO|nr:hypothetical protein B0J11DRAFT_615662 [Dendryphion nanum]
MKLNTSLFLTTITTLTLSTFSSAYTCYETGYQFRDTAQRLEAIDLAYQWCDQIGRRYFGVDEQVKDCYSDFDNGNARLMVRMKNGHGVAHFLDPEVCKGFMREIVVNCRRGGMDDVAVGWRARVDPGEGCDA